MKMFTGTYQHEGRTFTFYLEAESLNDAERRLNKIQLNGKVDGEVVTSGFRAPPR